MRSQLIMLAAPALLLAACSAARAQSSVDPVQKWSWGENIGWMNWRDAGTPPAARGARVHATFLSGLVWCENVGWLNLGDGSPADGASYANATGDDAGVNLAADGSLSGLAWGENVGWVNFAGGALANPPRPARLDRPAARLRGAAWAPAAGWINFDSTQHYVALAGPQCPCDWDNSGTLNSQDFFEFIQAFFAGEADFDRNGVTNSQDFFDFLLCFFEGCE